MTLLKSLWAPWSSTWAKAATTPAECHAHTWGPKDLESGPMPSKQARLRVHVLAGWGVSLESAHVGQWFPSSWWSGQLQCQPVAEQFVFASYDTCNLLSLSRSQMMAVPFSILLSYPAFPSQKERHWGKTSFSFEVSFAAPFSVQLATIPTWVGRLFGHFPLWRRGGVRSLTSCISAPLNKEPKLWWVICRQFRTHLVTKMISLGHRSLHFSASKPSFSCRLPLSIGLEGCKQTLQKLHPQGCFAPLLHLGPDGSVLCNTLVLCVLLPCLTPPPISHRGRAI